MHPQLFRIPGLDWPINSYGFMIMIGFLLATYVGVRRAREIGIKSDLVLDIGIIAMIFGIIGAKINYVLQYPEQYRDSFKIFDLSDGGLSWLGGLLLGIAPLALWYWRTGREENVKLYSWQNGVLLVSTLACAVIGARALYLYQHRLEYRWDLVREWQSGFVLYGGLIAGVLAGMLYTKMRGQSIARMGDIAGPSMMLGIAFGRIGCLLNGCCWGKPTTLPWGLKFPANSAASRQLLEEQQAAKLVDLSASEPLPVHPTQVYETIATLAAFFLLTWYWKKKKKVDGEVLLLSGMAYAIWRFLVEFMRGDKRPEWIGTLSYSQSVSLGLFVLCGVWLFFLRTRPTAAEQPGLASASSTPASPTAPTTPAEEVKKS